MSLPIHHALLSVSDKTALLPLAEALAGRGVRLLSTGGTRRHLVEAGLEVEEVSAYTGFPELMDGRLKTLHPKIFGGILCRHDREDDMQALGEHGIRKLELVVVNLYPFQQTVAREGVTLPEAIEQIDIGGPSLVRAAAKNHAFCAVATDPAQYEQLIAEINQCGGTSPETRRRLAHAAFEHTAAYDRAIADYMAGHVSREEQTTSQEPAATLPQSINHTLRLKSPLRYGENPHQRGGLYTTGDAAGTLVTAEKLHGKELSYNNLLDLDSAVGIARSFDSPAAAVIKHNNPCGAAVAEELAEAAQRAMAGDPVSAFGSIVAFNRPVDVATAEVLATPGQFIEAIAAPEFTPAALELLTTKPKWKANVRLLALESLDRRPPHVELRPIDGGWLAQDADVAPDPEDQWEVVTEQRPDETQRAELRFAWQICRFVKSNAIVLTKHRSLIGAGAGQMSRVDSVEIAITKAGDRSPQSVLGSDAFFPFPDSIERAAAAGVSAVIQPGGSRRDDEVIAACNQHGLPMIFTGRRHFRH